MTKLTAEQRAEKEAQAAALAAELAADQTATENERRAAELEKLQPLVGIIGTEAWNANAAAIAAARGNLPQKMWSAAEHYLNTHKALTDQFAAAVAAAQPVADLGPVPIPAQVTAPAGDEA